MSEDAHVEIRGQSWMSILAFSLVRDTASLLIITVLHIPSYLVWKLPDSLLSPSTNCCRSTGIKDVCFCAHLYMDSGVLNSSLHARTRKYVSH